jgi:fatty acid desaturase
VCPCRVQSCASTTDCVRGHWLLTDPPNQVEHHCWPTLSMLSYQKAAPELRTICERHGVPYTQESVWVRLVRTVEIMVGTESMRRFPEAALRR